MWAIEYCPYGSTRWYPFMAFATEAYAMIVVDRFVARGHAQARVVMNIWAIRNIDDPDLFWSQGEGWVDSVWTTYSDDDKAHWPVPIIGGCWVLMGNNPDA